MFVFFFFRRFLPPSLSSSLLLSELVSDMLSLNRFVYHSMCVADRVCDVVVVVVVMVELSSEKSEIFDLLIFDFFSDVFDCFSLERSFFMFKCIGDDEDVLSEFLDVEDDLSEDLSDPDPFDDFFFRRPDPLNMSSLMSIGCSS